MTENKKTTTTNEENKKAVENIVAAAKKAAPKKGGIAASIATAKIPAQEKPAKKAPSEKVEVKKPAEKADAKTEALKNSLLSLHSFTGKEKDATVAAKAIASRDVDVIKAILAGLPAAERSIFMALNNSFQQEKTAKEKEKKTLTKLDGEKAERARVSAIVTTLFESLSSMKAISRKEMKAGDVITCDDIAFLMKAKTHDDIFCAFFEKACKENKNIARHVPDYVISNAPFPDGTRILRPVTPAHAGAK